MKDIDWPSVAQAVTHAFEMKPDALITDDTRKQALHAQLTMWLAQLWARDAERLVQLMYRIDVKESIFIAATQADDPPAAMATAVLDRIALKVWYRKLYQEEAGSGDE